MSKGRKQFKNMSHKFKVSYGQDYINEIVVNDEYSMTAY